MPSGNAIVVSGVISCEHWKIFWNVLCRGSGSHGVAPDADYRKSLFPQVSIFHTDCLEFRFYSADLIKPWFSGSVSFSKCSISIERISGPFRPSNPLIAL